MQTVELKLAFWHMHITAAACIQTEVAFMTEINF